MTKLIDIYNENKDKSKNTGIYVWKGRNIILASITEEIVDQFLDAKILLNNLIIAKKRFYSEYNPFYKANTKSNDKSGNRSSNFNLNNKITIIKGAKFAISKSIKSNKSNKNNPIYMPHKNRKRRRKNRRR